MTPHLLTVFLFMADGSAVETRMGIMGNADLCNVTGRALVASLTAEDPTVRVTWTCIPAGVSA